METQWDIPKLRELAAEIKEHTEYERQAEKFGYDLSAGAIAEDSLFAYLDNQGLEPERNPRRLFP